MDKKIIFLDLDGTLTNDEKKITPKTKEALMDIQKRGHIVALASGRPTPGMGFIAKSWNLKNMVDMLCHLMVEKLSTGKQRRQFLRILWIKISS